MIGEFLVFKIGENTIGFSENVSKMEITLRAMAKESIKTIGPFLHMSTLTGVLQVVKFLMKIKDL